MMERRSSLDAGREAALLDAALCQLPPTTGSARSSDGRSKVSRSSQKLAKIKAMAELDIERAELEAELQLKQIKVEAAKRQAILDIRTKAVQQHFKVELETDSTDSETSDTDSLCYDLLGNHKEESSRPKESRNEIKPKTDAVNMQSRNQAAEGTHFKGLNAANENGKVSTTAQDQAATGPCLEGSGDHQGNKNEKSDSFIQVIVT